MTTLPVLRELFRYDHWANGEALKALTAAGDVRPARLAFAHVVATKRNWYSRVAGEALVTEFFPDLALPDCVPLMEEAHALWSAWLESFDPALLEKQFDWVNFKGEPHRTPYVKILHHVVLHGQHHRGQVASHLRAAGKEPPRMDLVYSPLFPG